MDKEVKSVRKMAMPTESCWSCHMRRVLVVASLDAAYLPIPSYFSLFVPSVWQVAAMLGQVACLGSLFGSSSTCHHSYLLPPLSSLSLFRQNIYVNDAEPATERCTALRCLFLSFGTHIKFVCGFVQRNMSLPEPELKHYREGRQEEWQWQRPRLMAMYVQVNTDTHTRTLTCPAHSHNCCEACSIDWHKVKQGECFCHL